MTLYLLSDELCAFMGLPCGSRATESTVYDHLLHYIELMDDAWITHREIRDLLPECDWSIPDVELKLRKHFLRPL
jgi:hypothetical protein